MPSNPRSAKSRWAAMMVASFVANPVTTAMLLPAASAVSSGAGTVSFMEIIAALFIDEIDLRQVPARRPDRSPPASSSAPLRPPLPFTWAPHLVVIIRCPEDGSGQGVLEVTFHRGDEQVARSVQPFDVEPGKFTYRLVRAELEFDRLRHSRSSLSGSTRIPTSRCRTPSSRPADS